MTSPDSKNITLTQKLFLVLCVPFLFLVFLEITCRVFDIDGRLSPLDREIQLDMPTWMMHDQNTPSRLPNIVGNRKTIDWLSLFEEGPGFRVRLIPNVERSVSNTFSQIEADRAAKYHVKANSVGFRGPQFETQKAPDTFRILVFGDSSSFGWGVNQDEYFSALLPGLLAEKNPEKFGRTEVLNFAIPGDSSEYGRLIVEHFIPPLEGDLVILGFGANDAKRVPVPHTAQVDRFRAKQTLQTMRFIASHSAFYRSLDALVTRLTSEANKKNTRQETHLAVNSKRYIINLKEMSRRAIKNNIENVLILNLCTPSDYAKHARLTAQSLRVMYLNGQAFLLRKLPEIQSGAIHRELVQEMRDSYAKDLEKNPSFHVTSDSCHPNKLGQRMVAEELAEIIANGVK